MASTVASTFTAMTSSAPTEKLRYPFQVTYDTSAYAAGRINKSCDKTISFTKSGVDGVVKMIKPMSEKVQPYVTNMTKKCKPYTDQVTPYIKSIPYMDTAKNNAPLMFALTVIAKIVLLCLFLFYSDYITFARLPLLTFYMGLVIGT